MAASSLASVGAVRLSVILGGPASVVLLGGTTVPPPSGLVTVEYSAEFDARSRRRAHESIDCVLKNSEAFGRAFEDCVIKRGEKRHGIAGYPRHQLGPQRTCARAAAGAGTVRRRATSSAAARRGRGAGWLWLQDLPSRRPTVITSALEPSAAPDDVSYGRCSAAVISPDLGDCFAAGILGQNLRPFDVWDLSFYSRICHRFSRILVMHP